MDIRAGTRFGPYEIIESIGVGGMGEVYRARDTRLERDVALKVLSDKMLDNDDAKARFQVEAKSVAALSHTNILSIHDFGEESGTVYAVTELLEGMTLSERLLEGPIPTRKVFELASQMADGMAAAHERGIVHRDLKPGNIYLTEDGTLKILDFGLAKGVFLESDRTQVAGAGVSTSPGTVLGTTRYMSPEQVRASEVDHRSDIFSFGIVLWEMITGDAPFAGDSAVETMNAILSEDPVDRSTTAGVIPPVLGRIVHRCLEKEPAQRFQSARDLAFALRSASETSTVTGALQDAPSPSKPISRLVVAGLVVIAALLGGVFGRQSADVQVSEPVQVTRLTHSGQDSGPSASPDGQTVAFTSERDGIARIWLRQVRGGTEAPLTEGPDWGPRFSPDGSTVLFVRNEGNTSSAYRVPVLGGSPRKLLDDVNSACWSPDGDRIAFVRWIGSAADPIIVLGVHDLRSSQTTELLRDSTRSFYGVGWSPDGQWLCVSATSVLLNTTVNSIVLVHAETGEVKNIPDTSGRLSAATWSPDSKSLIVAESTSMLGDISSGSGRLTRVYPSGKEAETLFWVQSVYAGGSEYVRFDFLADDTLVFDEILWRGTLSLVDIAGSGTVTQGRQLTTGNSRDRQPAYSPDGRSIAFSSNRSGNLDIWTLLLETGELHQVTDDAAEDWDPAFSADGSELLWSSNRGGVLEIWKASADGSAAHQVTNDTVDAENPGMTPDGKQLVYVSGNSERQGIWVRDMSTGEESIVAEGAYFLPELSPDGRYVLYLTNDTEKNRGIIYVKELATREVVFEFEAPFLGFQAAITAGRSRWMPDGSAIVFVGTLASGRTALFRQEFVPGQEAPPAPTLLVDLDTVEDLESFGISPDGTHMVVASFGHSRSLKLAKGSALIDR